MIAVVTVAILVMLVSAEAVVGLVNRHQTLKTLTLQRVAKAVSPCKTTGMGTYSKDLRLKVLSAADRGVPRKEIVEVFDVSLATIKRWLKRRRETGDVETSPLPGRPSVKGAALREWLPTQLSASPDLTLAEHCEAFEDQRGMRVSTATMSRNIRRLPGEWPLKKSPSRPRSATRKKGRAGESL